MRCDDPTPLVFFSHHMSLVSSPGPLFRPTHAKYRKATNRSPFHHPQHTHPPLRSSPLSLSPSAALSPRRVTPVLHRRVTPIVRAAAGDAADPHEVLGLKPGADYDTVNRVYRKLTYEAKVANDKARMAEIESAHSLLMTRFMMARIQAGASSDVRGADSTPLLPWRPRVLIWGLKWIGISLALTCLPVLWSLGSSGAGPQPIQFAFLAYLVLNCMKLWQWGPPPAGGGGDSQKAVVVILARAAGLTLGSLSLGIFVSWSLPDMIMGATVSGALPAWFYESQWQVMTLGACAMGFIFNVFFR